MKNSKLDTKVQSLWSLPDVLPVGDAQLHIDADFRTVLQVMACLEDSRFPEFYRWHRALALFYRQPVPRALEYEAMAAMADFIRCGAQDRPGPKLIDWQQDAQLIVADINRTAGQEVRSLSFLHWWTFLGWFHAIGQGQLSTVVAIRQKLLSRQRLEDWEKDFYRQNKALVDMAQPLTDAEQAEKDWLNRLLNGAEG